jgi:oligopeptide/dipeptide ABC transporter ATP-binding protein
MIYETSGARKSCYQCSECYTGIYHSALPQRRRERVILQGETPNPAEIPRGCRFHPRCPLAVPACAQVDPALERKQGHEVACIRV